MLSRVTPSLVAAPTAAAPATATASIAAAGATGLAPIQAGSDDADEALWRTPAARRAERTWALQHERTALRDPNQRRYVASVERVLASFDSVSEWADFIAFLTRLAKTVQTPAPDAMVVPAIPHKHVVAKRLSQCLNPALPGGVHAKALEVYALILTRIGRDGLRRDLGVWTPGLLPFYAAAGLSSRGQIVDIFTRFYLPLGGDDLRPLAAALVAAILPGLDDEAAEHSDATNRLLDRLASLIGFPAFASALWLVMTQTANVRRAGLNLTLRRLPKLASPQPPSTFELDNALGNDRGLMPRSLAACLRVGGVLERRLALDVLIAKLPLASGLFPRLIRSDSDEPASSQSELNHTVTPSDALLLVDAAARVVLRRDVSLNRRLYAWLLGNGSNEVDTGGQEDYLKLYTLPLLSRALVEAFQRFHYPPEAANNQQAEPGEPQETHRTFIALLDKWEIGGALTSEIILNILAAFWESAPESLRAAAVPPSALATVQGAAPVSTTAGLGVTTTEKMLMAAVDPQVLYTQLAQAIHQEMSASGPAFLSALPAAPATNSEVSMPSGTALLGFVLTAYPITDDEERTVHVPATLALLLSHALELLTNNSAPSPQKEDKVGRALYAAQLALKHTASSVFSFYHVETDTIRPGGLAAALSSLYGAGGNIDLAPLDPLLTVSQAPNVSTRILGDIISSDPPSSDLPPSSQEATRTVGSELWTPAVVMELLGVAELVLAQCLLAEPLERTLTLRAAEILQGLLRALDAAACSRGRHERVMVPWIPDKLATIALERLTTSTGVDVVQALIEVLVMCATCRALEKPYQLRSRRAVQLLTDRLLSLLGAQEASQMSAATSLFLALQGAAPTGLVESCLTARLVTGPNEMANSSTAAGLGRPVSLIAQGSESLVWRLGVLWLQLDERGEDTTFLHAPVRLILSGLCGPPGVAHRQIASSWVRAYVKSFSRVVGPILADALSTQVIVCLDASAAGTEKEAEAHRARKTSAQEDMFPPLSCTQPADTAALASNVALLVGVVKEGGNAALRTMASTAVGGVPIGPGSGRVKSSERLGAAASRVGLPPDTSLLDATVVMAARLLATNPTEMLIPTAGAGWSTVHAAAADLIQAIAARQSLPLSRVVGVLTVLSRAVRRATRERNVLTQDSLLSALHDVLFTSVPNVTPSARGGRDSPTEARHARRASDEGVPLAAALDASQVAGLLHILKDGIVPGNKDALTHWSDFTLSVLPAVKGHTKTLLAPLAHHLSSLVMRDRKLLSGEALPDSERNPSYASDAEVATHLALAERVVLMCVEDAMPSVLTTETASIRSGQRDTSGGLLGYVTRATGGEVGTPLQEGVRTASLPHWAADLLYIFVADAEAAWQACVLIEQASTTPRDDRAKDIRLLTAVRTRARCRRALERLYRLAPADTVLSLVGAAAREHRFDGANRHSSSFDPVLFDILPALVASPAVPVNYASDVVTGRRKAEHLHVNDTLLLSFITTYASRLDGTGAASVWPVVAAMGRDVLGNTAAGVPVRLVDSVLRAAAGLASAAAKDAAFAADRRFRKDVQDQVVKVLDLSVSVAGRAVETSTSSTSESLIGGTLFSRRPASTTSTANSIQPGSPEDSDTEPDSLIGYIARHGFQALRQLGVDADRLSASTSNAVYYLIIPALRNKPRYATFLRPSHTFADHLCCLGTRRPT